MNALALITATVEPDSRESRDAWVKAVARGITSLGPVTQEPISKYDEGYALKSGKLKINLTYRNQRIDVLVAYSHVHVVRTFIKNHSDAVRFSASVVQLVHAIENSHSAQELYDYSLEHRGYREMLNGMPGSAIKALKPGKILDAAGFPVTATVEPEHVRDYREMAQAYIKRVTRTGHAPDSVVNALIKNFRALKSLPKLEQAIAKTPTGTDDFSNLVGMEIANNVDRFHEAFQLNKLLMKLQGVPEHMYSSVDRLQAEAASLKWPYYVYNDKDQAWEWVTR